MVNKEKLQKTVSFRLNMKKEEEKALYETIMSHNRGSKDDPYGSGGAYIKAALKSFDICEDRTEQQNRDVNLVNDIARAVVEALKTENIQMLNTASQQDSNVAISPPKQETSNFISDPEEQMPEEAFSYLQNL
jgi:hypothetical protein